MRTFGVSWLSEPGIRAFFYQLIALAALALFGAYLFATVSTKLAQQNIQTGFGFLSHEAGFVISQSFIDYKPTDTYADAIAAGIVNTLVVSGVGISLASLLGMIVGIARLSTNVLLASLARVYVEVIRCVPLLLYLFFIYGLILASLPAANNAWEIAPHVFLSNRGIAIPKLHWTFGDSWIAFSIATGILFVVAIGYILRKRRTGGDAYRCLTPVLLALLATIAIAILILHPAAAIDLPMRSRFRITGGVQLTPEFTALVFGLALSTSAGIAEIIRSGMLAVGKGQSEAAQSLGLRRSQTLRLVIIPQAIRVIVPPLTSSYLTLFKNSSLAIAIGYPDFVMVSNMALTQNGQAVEIVVIMVLVYLGVSTAISLLMNWYNRKVVLSR